MNSRRLALKNIIKFGDTDIFPPCIEYQFVKGNDISSQEYGPSLHISYKKGDGSSRIATLIDPTVNLEYLSTAIEIADISENFRIEKALNIIHSYRFKPNERSGKLFDTKYGYHSFYQEILKRSKSTDLLVIKIDIEDFYTSISRNILNKAFEENDIAIELRKNIQYLLSLINVKKNLGLPIGGNASRILAELVINKLDHSFQAKGIDFVRFVDDYAIFSREGKELSILQFIRDEFHKYGFKINYRKFKILKPSELREEYANMENIVYDGTHSTNLEKAEEMLHRQINKIHKEKILNAGLLNCLKKTEPINEIAWKIADILGYLTNNFNKVALWIIRNQGIFYNEVNEKLQLKISNLISKNHGILSDEVNLCFAIRILSLRSTDAFNNELTDIFMKNSESQLIRSNIIFTLAKNQGLDSILKTGYKPDPKYAWEYRSFLWGQR